MRPHFFYFDRLPYKYFFLTVCYLFCFFCVSILFQEIGHHQEDNLGSQLVVNTRRELCAGFVNTINFTLFNYTRNKWRWKGKKRSSLFVQRIELWVYDNPLSIFFKDSNFPNLIT